MGEIERISTSISHKVRNDTLDELHKSLFEENNRKVLLKNLKCKGITEIVQDLFLKADSIKPEHREIAIDALTVFYLMYKPSYPYHKARFNRSKNRKLRSIMYAKFVEEMYNEFGELGEKRYACYGEPLCYIWNNGSKRFFIVNLRTNHAYRQKEKINEFVEAYNNFTRLKTLPNDTPSNTLDKLINNENKLVYRMLPFDDEKQYYDENGIRK